LASDTRIKQYLGRNVADLKRTEAGWCASGFDAQGEIWHEEADIVLVCCAQAAKELTQFANFPLTAVRGQITIVPESVSSKALRAVVCGDGYCAPAVEGEHVTGATHAFDDESTEIRAADHAKNLANLAEYAPRLYQALGKVEPEKLNGRASVRCSAPGAMPLVGEVQPNLYCSLAHGTRGLLSAGIAGELLGAQVCGQLPPLPAFIVDALAPLPRTRNKGQCAT
jgi:tRNA 5-methylaminomethyl-2-thiouridine biosynthesis bifunctional protein